MGTVGARAATDQLSLGYQLNLVEDVQSDLVRLERGAGEVPTLGVSGRIRLPRGDRKAFLDDLQATLQALFTRHGGADGPAFRQLRQDGLPTLEELMNPKAAATACTRCTRTGGLRWPTSPSRWRGVR